MSSPVVGAGPDDRVESEERLGSRLRLVREQAGECRTQAAEFDAGVGWAMELLASGWQGGEAAAVMSRLDAVRGELVGQLRAGADSLDERAERWSHAARLGDDGSGEGVRISGGRVESG